MMRALGLQRAKIAATYDKRRLAQSLSWALKSLCDATKARKKDFWINVDLNVHVRGGTAFEKHARINVYVPSDLGCLKRIPRGKVVPPDQAHRVRIPAELNELTVARGLAWVVKSVVTSVLAEQDDFWVNVDLNVHIKRGMLYETKARLNVYGDLIDPCDTTVVETIDWDDSPPEDLGTFCSTTVVESVDWNEVPSEILGTLCEDLEEIKE